MTKRVYAKSKDERRAQQKEFAEANRRKLTDLEEADLEKAFKKALAEAKEG